MFLHYISDEKIKITRDQVTTQSNIPVSNFVVLNSVDTVEDPAILKGGRGGGGPGVISNLATYHNLNYSINYYIPPLDLPLG